MTTTLRVLRGTGRLKSHPEILSADIAIRKAFHIGGEDVSVAKRLVSNYLDRPHLISELSASIGTLELESGAIKKAKPLLIHSSISPTENTIAQLKWISQQHKVSIPVHNSQIYSLEADAIAQFHAQNYIKCRDTLMDLYEFQPFSGGALADAGYISLVVLDDPEFVCKISESLGLIVYNKFSSLNNYIVSKLLLGKHSDVEPMFLSLSRLASNDREKAVLSATMGMFFYCEGKLDQARDMYKRANSFFEITKSHFGLSISLFYQAIMERKINRKIGKDFFQRALKEAKKATRSVELEARINNELKSYLGGG